MFDLSDFFRPKNRTQLKLWFVLQFLVRLIILAAPLYLIISFVDLYPFQLATAHMAASYMVWLGWPVEQDGVWLSVSGFRFLIDPDCTAWKLLLFFTSLMLAVPGVGLTGRLFGLIGIPLLMFGNLVRIASIVSIRAVYGQAAALAVHDWLWQLGLLVMAFGIWMIWFFSVRTRIKL